MMVSDFTLWGWHDGVSFRLVSGAGTMVSNFTLFVLVRSWEKVMVSFFLN